MKRVITSRMFFSFPLNYNIDNDVVTHVLGVDSVIAENVSINLGLGARQNVYAINVFIYYTSRIRQPSGLQFKKSDANHAFSKCLKLKLNVSKVRPRNRSLIIIQRSSSQI